MAIIIRLLVVALLVAAVIYLLRQYVPALRRAPLIRAVLSTGGLLALRLWLRRYGLPLLLQALRSLRFFR